MKQPQTLSEKDADSKVAYILPKVQDTLRHHEYLQK